MWICMNNAFVSVVQDKKDEKLLQVRARRREHLEACFPKENIIETSDSDYRYRVVVPRHVVATMLADKIMDDVTYTNFKNSVVNKVLRNMYTGWWFDHFKIQK